MGNQHSNINHFKSHKSQKSSTPEPDSSHNLLIGSNEFYDAVYEVNPTAATDFETGATYIVNGLQNLGITREQAEDVIYNIEDYIAQGVFGQNSYTNVNGTTYYGPQSTNFNSNVYSSMASDWTPYANYSDIDRANT